MTEKLTPNFDASAIAPVFTRRTTEYDKRADGWRYLRTVEKEVPSTHTCSRCAKPQPEPPVPVMFIDGDGVHS